MWKEKYGKEIKLGIKWERREPERKGGGRKNRKRRKQNGRGRGRQERKSGGDQRGEIKGNIRRGREKKAKEKK